MLPGGLRAFTANSSCSVSRSVSAASPAGCGMLRGHQISAGLWLSFLHNHREAIAAMDFFSVPTVTFNVLYVFFIIGHDRRRILHFNVTRHPTSAWIVQQLREAFPYEPPTKFLILTTMPSTAGKFPPQLARWT